MANTYIKIRDQKTGLQIAHVEWLNAPGTLPRVGEFMEYHGSSYDVVPEKKVTNPNT